MVEKSEPGAAPDGASSAQPGAGQAPVLPPRRVFVSYKSEDAERVEPLVVALKAQGFEVWWDRERMRPGESWAQEIEDALGTVGCVVVVWTQRSVALTDSYVFLEARAARRRGVIVPVLLDVVAPPTEFHEIQCVDLSRWRGGPRDPFFQDLVAAVRARIAGQPVPPARGPRRRLARRLLWSAAGGAATALAASAFAVFAAQDAVCGAPGFFQPTVSDACGALGLGHRPAQKERLAWEALPAKDCAALREHIARFPAGALRPSAEARLAARQLQARERWVPDVRGVPISTEETEPAQRLEAEARALAEAEAKRVATAACSSFTGRDFRFDPSRGRADLKDPVWQCRRHADGHRCWLKLAQVACQLERREVLNEERC